MADHPGKLIFTLPQEYRPKYFTGFALDDDPAGGGLMIYTDGEVRFIGPEPEVKGEVMADHPATGFTISVHGDTYLTIAEIWPDGDAPAHPTAADVKTVLEASGSKSRTLDDWCLLVDVEVTVEGVKVWL